MCMKQGIIIGNDDIRVFLNNFAKCVTNTFRYTKTKILVSMFNEEIRPAGINFVFPVSSG